MSETRYVTIPEKVTLTLEHPESGAVVQVDRGIDVFVKERTRDGVVFGQSIDGIMLGLAIRQAFTGCKPGQIIGLSLEQWEALCKAIRTPQAGYNPEVMFQVLPHAQAILDAPSTRPEPKPEPPAEEPAAAAE